MMEKQSEKSKSYYLTPVKIVRDLVHEYVNLTRFDIEIIDTVEFQRLKDVRQLTCQHVYPAARHTRFEHSLGVLELTRKAMKHLNQNKIIVNKPSEQEGASEESILNDHLQFNASLAALLHDVGHCPFSHMGESEFDAEEVRKDLYFLINEKLNNGSSSYKDLCEKIGKAHASNIGSVHEQLSCIVILEAYYDMLSNLSHEADKEDSCTIETDFELIIRSILGIEYDISTLDLFESNCKKNIIVRLINSDIFDMDKLDYIMRDSFFTGIGTPSIDTQRLFRNMYFNDKFSLVFTSRAVPALQNMIDSRDGLYMYVYNHHAVIFSDFIHTYITRRMAHNAETFLSMVYPDNTEEKLKSKLDDFQIFSLGLVAKPYLFSAGAIVEAHRSDSDLLSLLNVIHNNYELDAETRFTMLKSEISSYKKISPSQEDIQKLHDKISKALDLIHQLKTRKFLKPWWKTVFEFSNFMNQYFRDDIIRKQVGKFICKGGEYGLEASEFRSQIAKHVIFITQKLFSKNPDYLLRPFEDGDFFVIQRSTRFFAPDTIEKLEIALKSSEIIGAPSDINYKTRDYYVKTLTKIIPQKDYTSIYANEGFYVFSSPLDETVPQESKSRYYKLIEQIFVFVATDLVNRGEQDFVSRFQPSKNDDNGLSIKEYKHKKETAELQSMKEMFQEYCRKHDLNVTK